MEIWDAYDRNGNLAGIDLVRGEEIPDGFYHKVCEVLVRHIDGDFLIMKRDYSKPVFSGMFQATAGGSVIKGETENQCIQRELFEETGIVCSKFQLFDIITNDINRSIYYEYYCETDCGKDAIRLQDGETIDYRWIRKKQLIHMLERCEIIPVTKDRLRNYLNGKLSNKIL